MSPDRDRDIINSRASADIIEFMLFWHKSIHLNQ
jgi:hypothetical protein